MMNDWVTIVPKTEDVAETARELLELAESPADVRTARGGAEFLVPQYLADAHGKPSRRRRSPKKEEVSTNGD